MEPFRIRQRSERSRWQAVIGLGLAVVLATVAIAHVCASQGPLAGPIRSRHMPTTMSRMGTMRPGRVSGYVGRDSRRQMLMFSDENPQDPLAGVDSPGGKTLESLPFDEDLTQDLEKCPGCGRIGGPAWGCNGEGNQKGGLSLLLPWWPIKVYRPCPEYLANGGSYSPAGQGVEEILFGSKKNDPSAGQRSRD